MGERCMCGGELSRRTGRCGSCLRVTGMSVWGGDIDSRHDAWRRESERIAKAMKPPGLALDVIEDAAIDRCTCDSPARTERWRDAGCPVHPEAAEPAKLGWLTVERFDHGSVDLHVEASFIHEARTLKDRCTVKPEDVADGLGKPLRWSLGRKGVRFELGFAIVAKSQTMGIYLWAGDIEIGYMRIAWAPPGPLTGAPEGGRTPGYRMAFTVGGEELEAEIRGDSSLRMTTRKPGAPDPAKDLLLIEAVPVMEVDSYGLDATCRPPGMMVTYVWGRLLGVNAVLRGWVAKRETLDVIKAYPDGETRQAKARLLGFDHGDPEAGHLASLMLGIERGADERFWR